MPKSILIPVAIDHEPVLPRKIAMARTLLEPGGTITLLTVLEQVSGFVAEFVTVKSENHLSNRVLERLREVSGDQDGISCEVVTGKPGMKITEYAEKNGTDLIIVGSHRPGVQDYFLGSTAARVVRRAHCSVYVMR